MVTSTVSDVLTTTAKTTDVDIGSGVYYEKGLCS